jgi:hypothetical protein
MYSNKFVAVVSVNGKIAREVKDENGYTAYLPFGSEYSIKLKNLHSERAVVSISIDDRDVLGGSQVVVNGNEETEIKGFLDPSSNVAHNSFKFIEKTEKISEYRGDRLGDGLIRIEFQFEEPLPSYPQYPNYYPKLKSSKYKNGDILFGQNNPLPDYNVLRGSEFSCNSVQPASEVHTQSFLGQNEDGITVEGSVVNQKFATTHVRNLEKTKHTIVLQLKGSNSRGEKVVKPILTRKATKCNTCGRQNKTSSKFCSDCGTCLI